MNKKQILLEKLASLAVKVGANVQKGQIVVVASTLEAAPLAKLIQKEAYQAGAKKVYIDWSDDELNRNYYTYATDETLQDIPTWQIDRMHYFVDQNACRIAIDSRNPHGMQGVDMSRLMLAERAIGPKTAFFHNHYSASKSQWTIVAYPNEAWCKTVFPDAEPTEAWDKLFDAIMYTSRISVENNPVEDWKKHTHTLEEHSQKMNDYRFQSLHFKNSLGTDLMIELVENHLWAGGGEMGGNGVYFVPNIPTEEVFTMPHKDKVNGKVVSTKPLNYQGQLIQDFYFIFKDGKVVEYDAKVGKEALKSLIELDEGSSRLGEVALISHDSPISNLNILFNDTLFDENASCHLALGNAYSMNVVGGTTMSEEELVQLGYNVSLTHVDFMFGSADMEIMGTTHDGKQIQIFKEGNFVF
ncbi:MAG: aminopeptidase [Anaeroplasma bactoclasticum]|nr:aminopeptidase [Anaeroplasma bactoclasticum]